MITLSNAYKGQSPKRLEVAELLHGAVGTMYYVFGKEIKSFPCVIAHFIRTESEFITHHNSDEWPNTGALVMRDISGDMYEIIYSRASEIV